MSGFIYYYEYYPHYMGTMINTIRMTPKEFEQLVEAARVDVDGDDYDNVVRNLETQNNATAFAWSEFFSKKGTPKRIHNKVMATGLYKGEWEEGSYAFATSLKAAKKAVKENALSHLGF